MGVIIGVVVGYVLGARAGAEGLAEIEEAWRTITSSDEVKDMVAGVMGVAKEVARQGAGVMVQRLMGDDGPQLQAAA